MKLFLFLSLALSAVAAPDPAASAKAVSELSDWLKTPREQRGAPAGFAEVALTKDDAAKAAAALWDERLAFLRATREAEMRDKVITLDGKTMKFGVVYFGAKEDAPPGGRSLFISMHGGGQAPPQVNESQWRNQIALAQVYRAKEGVYIAPRAPTNNWNLWHEPHIDGLFDRLIENCVALEGVNPDRVYILGYSAGGDGVYQLAPRMSDRLAAAAMMAGHPNETSPRGLRNVPFALQVGELDSGVNRNKVGAEWVVKLDELKKQDPGGYEHFAEIHKGKGHWMDTDDRKAIPWMEKYTRNPFPERIVWVQDDVTHPTLYWLAATGKPKAGDEVIADRKGQTFSIKVTGAEGASVMLNDELANLDESVVVTLADKEIFKGTVKRTIGTMLKTLNARGDKRLIFSAVVP